MLRLGEARSATYLFELEVVLRLGEARSATYLFELEVVLRLGEARSAMSQPNTTPPQFLGRSHERGVGKLGGGGLGVLQVFQAS